MKTVVELPDGPLEINDDRWRDLRGGVDAGSPLPRLCYAAAHVVTRAEETIRTLAGTITEAARSANQIAASAGQQATGISQIRDSMNQIDLATRQTLTATQQSEHAARNLNSLGSRLRDLLRNDGDQSQ